MKEIVKTFFLTRDTACALFTKHRQRIQNFKETGDLSHTHKNKLNTACFAHDDRYVDSKYLAKRAVSDKALKYRAYE